MGHSITRTRRAENVGGRARTRWHAANCTVLQKFAWTQAREFEGHKTQFRPVAPRTAYRLCERVTYTDPEDKRPILRGARVPPPTVAALEKLVHLISKRVGRALERQGLLVRDVENSFLTLDPTEISGFDDLLGHSITYRIALGPHQGRKAFTLQTVPAVAAADDNSSLAKAAGFSLHAGVASEADEREKLEQMPCIFKCGVAPLGALLFGYFDGFELCITIRCLSAVNNLSVTLNRPVRSFGANTDSRVSSFTEGSTRV